MQTSEEIKNIVKEKYGELADQRAESKGCGCGCSKASDYSDFSEDYSKLAGYNPDADMGLGCGLPTELANISVGDTVLDLGSGAGNDVFVAREIVGKTGHVIRGEGETLEEFGNRRGAIRQRVRPSDLHVFQRVFGG